MLRIGPRGGDPRDQDNSQQAGTLSTNSPQVGHAARVGAHICPAQEAAEIGRWLATRQRDVDLVPVKVDLLAPEAVGAQPGDQGGDHGKRTPHNPSGREAALLYRAPIGVGSWKPITAGSRSGSPAQGSEMGCQGCSPLEAAVPASGFLVRVRGAHLDGLIG
jgi:hypothetical protein